MQVLGTPQDTIAVYDRAFAASGLRGVYETLFQRLAASKSASRFLVAMYAARTGRSAEAIRFLRQSAQRREPGTLWLAVHPGFASLRGQREFAALVASSFHSR